MSRTHWCTYGEGNQHGRCIDRAFRANDAMRLCSQALETVEAVKRNCVDRFEQMDLLSPPPVNQDEVDFWWSVHAACGQEYRRLDQIFWGRCPGHAIPGEGDGP